jgi:hypothetical protein
VTVLPDELVPPLPPGAAAESRQRGRFTFVAPQPLTDYSEAERIHALLTREQAET